MRILMLGWEFPPFIAGGLGTACYGLTKALDRLGHEVMFILPRPVENSHASHVRLLSPDAIRSLPQDAPAPVPPAAPRMHANGDAASSPFDANPDPTADPRRPFINGTAPYTMDGFPNTTFMGVPSGFSSPYPAFRAKAKGSPGAAGSELFDEAEDDPVFPIDGPTAEARAIARAMGGQTFDHHHAAAPSRTGAAYEGDMVANAERYARLVVALTRGQPFDVVHAHDWMTFPAGLAVAQVTGRPLVAHVHSTEFDRSGEHVNQRVYDIERRGMHGALRVVAVSEFTKSVCARRYGLDPAKIDVCYNGIDCEAHQPRPGERIERRDRIVLFLGRITMQKGPEYFIRAAKRILEKVPDVKFVVAGSGDLTTAMIEEAAHHGIGHRVLFTGFLRGAQVDQIFRMADCYVMPSVSEPFGIAPLEAMRNSTPVIISKQSGVAEVLTHALKVDFWDVDDIANKIVAVLRHPPLGQTLREHGSFELRKLTWDGAAGKCVETYRRAKDAQTAL